MTGRELVLSTLEFRNTEGRVPRQLWTLPWATERYPEIIEKMNREFGWDMSGPVTVYAQRTIAKGDPHAVGEYTDDWGCVFTNI